MSEVDSFSFSGIYEFLLIYIRNVPEKLYNLLYRFLRTWILVMENALLPIVTFACGVLFGLLVAYVLRLMQAKNAEAIARQIFGESEKYRHQDQEKLMANVQNNFGKLSVAVLKKSNEAFLQMAEQRLNTQTVTNSAELDSKKKLIDQQLSSMSNELSKVTTLIKEFEADRTSKFSALSQELTSLGQTSSQLQRALADSRSRGQWGERIAEDILRLSGFIEGVNYRKQESIDGFRPDYTFLLPKNLTLNMDVKFPLDNYVKYVNATAEIEQEKYRKDFIRDVRARVGEIVKRDYINTEQSTIDCVLVFIPNEQIYRFIHEEDQALIEDALSKKVILCSPMTLFIVLAIVHQAADNFALEKSSQEILGILNDFKKQWERFAVKMGEIEKLLNRTTEAYRDLTGVRTRSLEKSFKKIDALIAERQLLEEPNLSLLSEEESLELDGIPTFSGQEQGSSINP